MNGQRTDSGHRIVVKEFVYKCEHDSGQLVRNPRAVPKLLAAKLFVHCALTTASSFLSIALEKSDLACILLEYVSCYLLLGADTSVAN